MKNEGSTYLDYVGLVVGEGMPSVDGQVVDDDPGHGQKSEAMKAANFPLAGKIGRQ